MEHGTTTRQASEASGTVPSSTEPSDAEPSGTSALDTAPVAPAEGTRPEKRVLGRHAPSWWPLVAVLIVQAALSLRLVGADTAFEDEATYLWAGHLEWANWLHGAPIPPFAAYFSGAPVVYPPIGALADSVGGLTAARILSLAFMLGATALLWGAAVRLYGRLAAFFAAALFAVCGPTLHLGSFATYDAMAVFLIALAAWCVIRAGDSGDVTGRMVAAGAVLALANVTAYSSVLFDPIVILIALLRAFPKPGGKTAARRIAILLVVLITLLLVGVLIGGSSYLGGFDRTTLLRAPGAASWLTVLRDSLSWTGVITVLAVCGIVISLMTRQGRTRTWLLVVLTIAAILGPLEQARLHTAASLDKHVGLGAWFAAIAAGYAVDWFIAAAPAGRNRTLTCGACVLALAFPISLGASQSWAFSTSWPNSAGFTAILSPLVDHSHGRLLVEDPTVAEYYLPAGSQWQRWSSTRNIVLPSGASTGGPTQKAGVVGPGDAGTFAMYIREGYFSLIALNFADTTALDHSIAADIKHDHNYRKVEIVPFGEGPRGPAPGTYLIYELLKKHEPRT
jgi:Dolichyl-phosphate-mannose-protein mannosyltransferase